jgi:hypothetical protein
MTTPEHLVVVAPKYTGTITMMSTLQRENDSMRFMLQVICVWITPESCAQLGRTN